MRVILIRHFKVDHNWRMKCNCREFLDDLESYNIRSVIETKELDYSINTVYISTLSRTEETAQFLKGNKLIIKTPLINEVDLRGTSRIKFRMSGMMWYMISVLKWRMNSRKQNETYKETLKRAHEFLRIIEENKEDCIVISHGMFLTELMNIMIKRGYYGGIKDKRFKNGEALELRKE